MFWLYHSICPGQYFKNITVLNINISHTYRYAIAIESVDGDIIENIKMTNIIV
ncbi:MAG: hypothetical protein ACJARG_001781, partial [Arcticibacterium sp.]